MKTLTTMLIASLLFMSCGKKNELENASIKEGMIKMAIYYPNEEGKTFDMDYYSNTHMVLAEDLLGDSLKALVIDKGMSGRTAEENPPFVAVGYFYFDDIQSFQDAMGPNSDKLKADVPNFTNIQPMIQVSTVESFR